MDLSIEDAYATLALPPGASEAEVKAAWRRMVSKWHPDRNGHSSAGLTMQRINRAFEQIRQGGFAPTGTAGSADKDTDTDSGAGVDTDPDGDADDAASRARARGASRPAARTLARRVRLTLEEAARGCVKTLRGKLVDTCTACGGAGFRVLARDCPACDGAGAVQKRGWFGWYGPSLGCEACAGDGAERVSCDTCVGAGTLLPHRYGVTVRIPHGARDGDRLHVDARRFFPAHLPVELDIRVELVPHPLFRLDADGTIQCEMPVDGFAWMANRAVEVPTLGGFRPLLLNREQLVYHLPGQGFPASRRGPPGDQWVTVLPLFPDRLSNDQQILLDQLIANSAGADGMSMDPRLAAWGEALRRWDGAR